MSKARGKGKISNDLVAASFAAVLAVYAAGYSRTRDAARKFETQAEERRLAALTRRARDSGLHPTHEVLTTRESALTVRAGTPSPVTTPKRVHHTPSPAMPAAAAPQPRVAAHEPEIDTTATAMPAETAQPSAAAPPVIAPVPLPEEIASTSNPVTAASEPVAIPAGRWRDGVYTGVGDSPHGDIEARVVIKNGRIIEAGIATCDTRYPCSVLDHIVHQPVLLQSPLVDYVSHATESSDAYYYGLVDALKQAIEEAPGESTVAK